MLLFVLMPLLLFIGLPLLMLRLSVPLALWARRLAERQQRNEDYPTAEVLEATFEAEPAGVWPSRPTIEHCE